MKDTYIQKMEIDLNNDQLDYVFTYYKTLYRLTVY